MQHSNSFHTAHVDPSLVQANSVSPGHFRRSIDINNYTSRLVYIKDQGNCVLAIEPSALPPMRDFTPHIEIMVTTSTIDARNFKATVGVQGVLQGHDIAHTPQSMLFTQSIANALATDAREFSHSRFTSTVSYIIHENEIDEKGLVFHKESDICFSYIDRLLLLPHPNSQIGIQHYEVQDNKLYRDLAGVFVRIIDNEQMSNSFFYYSGKQIVEITPSVDRSKESGVYITISSTVNGTHSKETRILSFQDARDQFGIYSSREEAFTNGNPELISKENEARIREAEQRHKLKISEMNRALEELKIENETAKLRFERDIADLRNINTRLKEEIDFRSSIRDDTFTEKKQMREEKKLVTEDKFSKKEKKRKIKVEEKTAKIKVTQEIIKAAPLFITAALAVYAISKKNSSSNIASGLVNERIVY